MLQNHDTGIWGKLARPFSQEEMNLRVIAKTKDKAKGLVAPFVDARTIMKRLDDTAGVEGWYDHYEAVGDRGEFVFVLCSLSIAGVTKEDVGSGSDYKGACSDSLKRASVKFGVGRYLYSAERVWAQLDPKGDIQNQADVKRRILDSVSIEVMSLREPVRTPTNGQTR